MGGSLEVYALVWTVVLLHPNSFPDGLGERLAGAGLAALTNFDPCLFARCLGSDRREF
jgi:hypothetical protein